MSASDDNTGSATSATARAPAAVKPPANTDTAVSAWRCAGAKSPQLRSSRARTL
ncbi:MAG: hypothetical protein U1F67_15715 [Rubrivivax sp.]